MCLPPVLGVRLQSDTNLNQNKISIDISFHFCQESAFDTSGEGKLYFLNILNHHLVMFQSCQNK